jgi:hypothetical protein
MHSNYINKIFKWDTSSGTYYFFVEKIDNEDKDGFITHGIQMILYEHRIQLGALMNKVELDSMRSTNRYDHRNIIRGILDKYLKIDSRT